MAEPFRILVVPDFPTGFSDTAARRLVSIATSGARCGVYTLVSIDTRQKLPYNFDLADLRRHATCLEWQNGRFLWKDPDLARLPLTLDTPPEGELFSQIVRDVGLQSKDARRVEVAFARIAPPGDSLWQGDASAEIDVPLGRAGATKLQHMRLGRGTSQHVLVAGKTGSGKSSFLHALVTNAALYYSPHEIEFYLIDFKKGVEFKTYATHKLPHARVIAIESEREFGLSVLQRLDAELKERGDLMRRCGVQDLASYRAAKPDAVMPRVLLIIDEFQEFFTEDDPLSSQAALLLDRLVRQGRAFGIHVLLGSQSLGGAYSLARSTMGQVAVRIALQCSESDAHLILSEENTAARLLTRPGEAIYNDANGLLEGNNPFQVAWLPDAERETYLKQLQTMATEQKIKMPPPIVFEGNVPAEPSENATLVDLLASPTWQQVPLAPKAWLGAAVAIKEPTAAEFRRQSGSNLLICGQSTDSALGIMTASVLSLAVQHAPSAAEFYLLDGARRDDVEADQWQRIADALPHASQVVRPRKAAGAINEIAVEVARRDAEDDESAPPIYLFIYHLGRFRDLRRDDDAFGFGSTSDDNPPSASKQLAMILRDGPALGVHTTIWCCTFANTERWLDRPAMRELEMRIAFQMSAADSSSLIDSPIAAKLGVHRALLYLEEYGALEKFRPYGPPSDDWLDEAARRLQQAAASVSG